jgi:AcrR family transcriptional regulator
VTASASLTLYGSAANVPDARERIVRTAYDLFSRHGIAAVGIDRIIAEAAVAKTTLYRHFRSKDDLVVAVLERRGQLWTREWLMREVESRGGTATLRLLTIFDVFDEWFREEGFESCFLIAALLESRADPRAVHAASVNALMEIRAFVRELAVEARIGDPDSFARQWQTLMFGSIIAATAGDVDAASHARDAGSTLLAAQTRGRTERRDP